MVNVPPLLCSTPPPIDFGDEDDDVDVLPPTMGGAADEEFGDFLEGDSIKSDEPLPSSRPPSVTDLPPMSIYEGLIPPDEVYTNHSATPPPMDIGTKTRETTNKTHQSTPIIEAFNYSITHQAKETAKVSAEERGDEIQESPVNAKTPTKEEITTTSGSNNSIVSMNLEETLKTSTKTMEVDEQAPGIIHAAIKEQQQPVISLESNVHVAKNNNITPLTNIVSIEDLEDDLSEDELYSPKTPKNFTEADAKNIDYFKIHDIRQENTGEVLKSVNDEQSNFTPQAKSIPEQKFAASAFENLNSHASQEFNLPPPLGDGLDDDEAEDFGDFADFQDFGAPTNTSTTTVLVDNSVPVNNDIEAGSEDDFDDFLQHVKEEKYNNINTNLDTVQVQDSDKDSAYAEECKQSKEDDLTYPVNNLNSKVSESQENSQIKEVFVPYSDSDHKNEQFNDSFGDFIEAPLEEIKETLQIRARDENPEEQLASLPATLKDDAKNLNDGDDEFNDFADFEEYQETPPQEMPEEGLQDHKQDPENISKTSYVEFDGDDDDDFGDFNTAEPIASGPAPTIVTEMQTSQAISPASSSMQTPKNLNERISKVLQVMFISSQSTPSTPTESNVELKSRKIQDIPFTSIDAAKALEYQWLNSETRHSFIKSLGIDSRNILYGENWNPSLPRFAANLSFNPLKPMKPVTSNSGADSSCPPLDPVSVNTSDFNKPIMNSLGNIKRDNIELDWKAPTEQTTEALNNNASTPEMPIATASASVSFVATETTESLTIFENRLDNEDKFSKTPPISEMESVNTTFSSPLPSITTLEIDLPPTATATQILNDFKNIELNDSDDSKDALEVVSSTTFSGSFKETHIYTPPKTTEHSSSTSSTSTTSPSKAANIDFDYEKAAMGVIIDETVVKKEYRDIEYNSPFSTDTVTRTPSVKAEVFDNSNTFGNQQSSNAKSTFNNDPNDEFNDEFSDFQSVSSEATAVPTSIVGATPISTLTNLNPIPSTTSNPSHLAQDISKPCNVSACGMILSPAILIPQAISMESNKPKIEWGDLTTSINPEELARIEELFPEPKLIKSNASNHSQKSTPTHQASATTNTISAAVANKELEGNNEDDDWSDFVSVPVAGNNNKIISNNNVVAKSPLHSPFKQRSPVNSYKTQNFNNSNNDDEWSDFVSSAPHPPAAAAQTTTNTQGPTHRVPQFNSGAWQNANFYNNPLSLYHKGLNLHSAAANNQQQLPKNFQNNNNNYNQYNQFQTAAASVGHHHAHGGHQQIHIMQNFSTVPVPASTPERLVAAAKNNQFQVGSAKVAPSIALIPDLGFVAPAIPTHTSFISSLPKPSINTKK